jgi:hypothetical protein
VHVLLTLLRQTGKLAVGQDCMECILLEGKLMLGCNLERHVVNRIAAEQCNSAGCDCTWNVQLTGRSAVLKEGFQTFFVFKSKICHSLSVHSCAYVKKLSGQI